MTFSREIGGLAGGNQCVPRKRFISGAAACVRHQRHRRKKCCKHFGKIHCGIIRQKWTQRRQPHALRSARAAASFPVAEAGASVPASIAASTQVHKSTTT